ncbi:MAG TPA: MmcQ/YjbR family DNA-binding protein [Kofleriaceae bacterium]|jgi:predicted DNA-binding protein (MmcQ/YjbR family)
MADGKAIDKARAALKAYGMSYPGAHGKSPWPGHDDLAVNDKTFAYMSSPGEPFSVGCKLPQSSQLALMLPYVTPMPYGLGKSGWVSAKVPPEQAVDLEMFKQWIDESYRAQAPKKLVKQLDQPPSMPAAKVTKRAKPGTPRRAPAKKSRRSR